MKKNIKDMKRMLFVLLLTVGGMAMAQAPTPPRDTMYGRNPTYLYPVGWSDYYDTDFCKSDIVSIPWQNQVFLLMILSMS